MRQCNETSWNEGQGELLNNQGEDRNRSSHVDFLVSHNHSLHHPPQHQITSQIIPMSNFEVTELTWENGQLAIHELGGIFPPPIASTSSAPKLAWGGVGGAGETLESIVHQASYCSNPSPILMPATQHSDHNIEHFGSVVASSGGKRAENPSQIQTPGPPPQVLVKKRTRSQSDHRGLPNDHESASASPDAGFSRENNDPTMMTWSLESPRITTRTKTTLDEDSACHGGSRCNYFMEENQEKNRETKGEMGRSYSARKGRAAAVHNQSERRRRDRINQKMKALQKLVPNASKTDKASMLDEVIEYLKQLQAQLQMMSHSGFMPQIMMPLGMQQQLHQMSILARMGMGANLGMGMGMLESPNIGHTPPTPQMICPQPGFVVPQMIAEVQRRNSDSGASSSAHLQDNYNALLAQSMNIELCNRIAALQRQQQTPSQAPNNRLPPNNHVQQNLRL